MLRRCPGPAECYPPPIETAITNTLERAVAAGVTPGGVAVVAEADEAIAEVAVGELGDGVKPRPAHCDTFYDIASLTKPIATTACAMKLVAAGDLELDAPATRWLPELRGEGSERITLRQLLGHGSGLPAHVPFYRRLWAADPEGAGDRREALLRMAASTALEAEPGTRVNYSDLGFILLGFALERAAGERLDDLAGRLVFRPLGMERTRFVDLDQCARPEPVAPTELCRVRGLVRGEVHDENAHAAGGICGHAGLFSTARDVSIFARAMCRAAAGDRPAGFDPDVVRALFRERAAPGGTWRLGWDTPSPRPGESSSGDRWPQSGVGHLGFTGTSMWLAPAAGHSVVLLTNRVHPTREREGIRALRRELMDAAAAAMGYPPRPESQT